LQEGFLDSCLIPGIPLRMFGGLIPRARILIGEAEIETRPVMATLKIIFALIGFSAAFSSTAFAGNCRAIPFGPEQRACVMREYPGMFEAKLDRCRQLARERGDTSHTATGAGGMKEFVQDCMRGKQR
jgi:hypothetical protein